MFVGPGGCCLRYFITFIGIVLFPAISPRWTTHGVILHSHNEARWLIPWCFARGTATRPFCVGIIRRILASLSRVVSYKPRYDSDVSSLWVFRQTAASRWIYREWCMHVIQRGARCLEHFDDVNNTAASIKINTIKIDEYFWDVQFRTAGQL